VRRGLTGDARLRFSGVFLRLLIAVIIQRVAVQRFHVIVTVVVILLLLIRVADSVIGVFWGPEETDPFSLGGPSIGRSLRSSY